MSSAEKGPAVEIPAPGGEISPDSSSEALASPKENSPSKQPPAQISVPQLPVTQAGPVANASDDAAGPTPQSDSHLTAADSDKIEKQWVDSAKKVIADTREDPRRQNRELSKLKADYIKKRYKKVIKVD